MLVRSLRDKFINPLHIQRRIWLRLDRQTACRKPCYDQSRNQKKKEDQLLASRGKIVNWLVFHFRRVEYLQKTFYIMNYAKGDSFPSY